MLLNLYLKAKDITYDEDSTYRIKGGKGQRGYVLNIAENCSKDNPFQVITIDRIIKCTKGYTPHPYWYNENSNCCSFFS